MNPVKTTGAVEPVLNLWLAYLSDQIGLSFWLWFAYGTVVCILEFEDEK